MPFHCGIGKGDPNFISVFKSNASQKSTSGSGNPTDLNFGRDLKRFNDECFHAVGGHCTNVHYSFI